MLGSVVSVSVDSASAVMGIQISVLLGAQSKALGFPNMTMNALLSTKLD